MNANLPEQLQVEGESPSRFYMEDDHEDDLSREVFGVLGLPIDVINLENVLQKIDAAIDKRTPFLMSTPNVNFLMMSQSDEGFRESLMMSDLCPVDGMPLVWVSKLLGIPLKGRLSGADIFDELRSRSISPKLNVFLFGGGEGIAATVARKLNDAEGGMTCVGALNPGYGSIDDMSLPPTIEAINSSEADLLTVFLSARKAQYWLLKNHDRLRVPVRVQLGATINLQAGKVRRAPSLVRELGFEWLWRIKEEPYLWQRYFNDGIGFLGLFLTRVVPLAIEERLQRRSGRRLQIFYSEGRTSVSLKFLGSATISNIQQAIAKFRMALSAGKTILIDLSAATAVDSRFFGLFVTVRKEAALQGCSVDFVNPSPRICRKFRRNGFEFLLKR